MNKHKRVAFIGNPNCGKSSLFNRLSGLTQKTSNLPGTTVEAFESQTTHNKTAYSLIDLPGIYSLYSQAEDEKLVVQYTLGLEEQEKPEVLLVVLDSSNLRRNLLLYSQIAELGIPTACVLTMQDTAERRGIEINLESLTATLGVPCVWFNPRNDKNTEPVWKIIDEACVPKFIVPNTQIKEKLTAHWQGVKLEGLSQETLDRYKFIEEIVKTCTAKKLNNWQSLTLKFDQWATHAICGYLLFALITLILFQGVFSLAAYPMEWIETSFQWISNSLTNALPESMATNFLTDGLLSGLEGVIVFVPQIFILFFFIGILEDSGYMVRASFITDRVMRKLGLNGRSIIPMVGGFACAIPSIMATRSIKSKSERLATMLVIPLMSCSARLPVYVLLVSIAIPLSTFWGPFHAQTFVITAAYMSGIVVAIILSFILNLFTKSKATGSEFILELPTYQKPRLQTVIHQAWLKCLSFLTEAGKVIVLISMVLWGLSNFGPKEAMKNNPNKLEASYAGHIGKFIEPAIQPLGYDWKTGIALISSFAAREVFVGTMGTLFQSEEDDTQGIRDKMQAEINPETGRPLYGIPYALSLIVFYAFALQCMSTMAVMKRETGSWKWPIIQFLAYGFIAYIGAFIIFQISTYLENSVDSIPDSVAAVSHHLFHFF